MDITVITDHDGMVKICKDTKMIDGKNWVSDFIQNNMWVYKGDGIVNINNMNIISNIIFTIKI